MKLKAKHWIKYQGEWHKAGDVFHIHENDAEEMKAYGEVIAEAEDKTDEAPDEAPEEAQEETQEEPVRRGRRRKIEMTE